MTTRKRRARDITEQEQKERDVGLALSRLVFGDEKVDGDTLVKELLGICEKGESRTFKVEFLPLRLEQKKLTLISVGGNSVIEVLDDASVPWTELGIPPNFAYRLLRMVVFLLRRERTLVANGALQTPEAVESFRKSVVDYEKAYINERLGVSRGGSARAVDATDEQRKEFSYAYDVALKRWSTADDLYEDDPAGARSFVDRDSVARWLLDDFTGRRANKCKPNRLAHFDAAIRSGIEVQHKAGKRKGKLVSLSTIEKVRKAGDVLRGINRKMSPKRSTKAVAATTNS